MFDGALASDVVEFVSKVDSSVYEAIPEGYNLSITDPRQIFFIDANIPVANSFSNSTNGSSEVVVLDAAKDGVHQIANYLAGQNNITSIHIISHGSEGQINVGNSVLSSKNLTQYNDYLAEIGNSLTVDGDVLLYGCDVADNTGKEFVAALAEMTGADVAASDNLTGSINVGGDWLLEVKSGAVEADTNLFSEFSGFSGLLTTPAVSDGGRTGYIMDADALVAAPGMNVTNGGDYGGGGSLTIAVTSVDTSETLSLKKVGTASSANNVVSVVGSTLYLGSGSGSNVIGSIDLTNNGENGNNLQINFLSDSFTNASFETGDLTGWTTDTANQINIGTDSIAGIPTPDDTTNPVDQNNGRTGGGDAGDGDAYNTKGTWTADIKTNSVNHGTYSLQLKSAGMQSVNAFDVIHGPSVYSDIFEGENGQTISFDWRALAGSDAYDVFGYIVNTDTNATSVILNQTGADDSGNTSWAKANVTIPATGNYRFVFVSGTYDYTGGRALGASLYIDNIQVFNAVDDPIVSQVAKLVTYETTATTLTDAERAERTLTFTATDADGNAGTNTATIFQTFPEEIHAAGPGVVESPVSDTILPPQKVQINRDGLQTFVRQGSVTSESVQPLSGIAALSVISDDNEVRAIVSDGAASGSINTQTNVGGTAGRSVGAQLQTAPSAKESFNVSVMPRSESGGSGGSDLSILNGIKNPEVSPLGVISFSIPGDAFAKSSTEISVTLTAVQSDGSTLPSWLTFDPVTGQFEGQIPEDYDTNLEISVTATDENGNEVTTKFLIAKNDKVSDLIQDNILESPIKTELQRVSFAAEKLSVSKLRFSQQLQLSKVSLMSDASQIFRIAR